MSVRGLVGGPVAALVLLAGCGTQQGHGMAGGGGMGMGGQGGMGTGNPAQMCAMYRDMMAGRTPAEQQAAMESQMRALHGGTVTPEQARMHRETMERHCAGAPGTR